MYLKGMQQEGYTEFTVNNNTTKTVSVYIFQIMQQEGYTEFTVNNNTTYTVSVYIYTPKECSRKDTQNSHAMFG